MALAAAGLAVMAPVATAQSDAAGESSRREPLQAELLHEFAPAESVRDVVFSRFGTYLATASYYGTVTLYNSAFEELETLSSPVAGQRDDPVWDTWLTPVAFSADESRLYVGNYIRRGTVGVLRTPDLEEITTFVVDDRARVRDITLTGDGAIVAATTNTRATLWSTNEDEGDYEQVIGEATYDPHGEAGAPGFRDIRFSSDGALMAVELSAGYVAVYTMKPELFSSFQYLPPVPEQCGDVERGFRTNDDCTPGDIYGFRFSPDGQWLLVGTERDGLVFWRRTGHDRFEQVRQVHEPPYRTPGGFALDGDSRLAFTVEDESLRVWGQTDDGWNRDTDLHPQGRHGRVALSPDGRYLVAGTGFSYVPEFSARTTLVEPALRVWRLSGAGMRPGAQVAEALDGALSPVMRAILTPARAAALLEKAGDGLLEPRGIFETEEEYHARRRNARATLKTTLQELTEEHLGAKVDAREDGVARISFELDGRGTYDVDARRYTLALPGQTAEIPLERAFARPLYRQWRDARVLADRVPDVTGYDYTDFRLTHPAWDREVPIAMEVNPFTGAGVDPLVTRRPVVGIGPHLELRDLELDGVFPALYRSYDERPLGTVVVANEGGATIGQLTVRFAIPGLTVQEAVVTADRPIGIGEQRQIDLPALFDRRVLEAVEGDEATAELTVSYRAGGEQHEGTITEQVQILNRNAIRWDDDAKVAAFMSVNEETVARFAARVTTLVDDRPTQAFTRNLLTAMRVYEGIRQADVRYVVDPTSAYEELSQSSLAIDHVRFPAETLSYGAGDCDDLSVLFNTVLESVGVPTAFITTPGHIFAAFDLGLKPEQARRLYSTPEDLIFRDGRTWVPVETTLLSEGFLDAWRTGARQWRAATSEQNVGFFTTASAWTRYAPAGVEIPADVPTPADTALVESYRREQAQLREQELDHHLAGLPKNPGTSVALTRAGVVHVRYGSFEEALELFDRAAAERPTLAPLINAASVLSRMGRHDEALDYLGRARRLDPEHPRVHLGMAVSYLEAGDPGAARSSYRRLTRIAPALAERYPLFAAAGDETGGRAGGQTAADDYFTDALMEP